MHQCSHFPPVWGGRGGSAPPDLSEKNPAPPNGGGQDLRSDLPQMSNIRLKSLENHKETGVNNEKRSKFSSGRLTAAENHLKPLICLKLGASPPKSCPPTFQPRMETLHEHNPRFILCSFWASTIKSAYGM